MSPLSTGCSSFQGDPSERVVWLDLFLYRNDNKCFFVLSLDGQVLYISFGLYIYPDFLAERKQPTICFRLKPIQVNIFMNKDF